ncbi:MAG: DUF475 domain-containing protein [Pseudobdellovibrio sp.]|nr:DUF475 domain-containing protein [Pseudobdellovibrio sp.]
MLKYIRGSLIITVIGLATAMGFEWYQTGSTGHMLQAGLTALILAVLEISLSFDNAVVNATVIKKMDEVWKRRFLTWGILIAVFGMRLVFPLAIVSIIAHINPIEALLLSLNDPAKYAELMTSAHITVAAFGGMFLFMVFLHYFMNEDKEDHWIHIIEKPLVMVSQYKGVEIIVALVSLLAITSLMAAEDQIRFLVPGLWGMITYLIVHSFSDFLESMELTRDANLMAKKTMMSAGFGMFMYLEILDASFSFDGVIGAFAITQSLIQIMIGLSIGAFFVRSLTLYLVEKDTLGQIRFLEHGAFYALGALSMMMLLDYFFHIPEWLTGLTGAAILAVSILWSFYVDRKSGNT